VTRFPDHLMCARMAGHMGARPGAVPSMRPATSRLCGCLPSRGALDEAGPQFPAFMSEMYTSCPLESEHTSSLSEVVKIRRSRSPRRRRLREGSPSSCSVADGLNRRRDMPPQAGAHRGTCDER
jgi:hypothetical protein